MILKLLMSSSISVELMLYLLYVFKRLRNSLTAVSAVVLLLLFFVSSSVFWYKQTVRFDSISLLQSCAISESPFFANTRLASTNLPVTSSFSASVRFLVDFPSFVGVLEEIRRGGVAIAASSLSMLLSKDEIPLSFIVFFNALNAVSAALLLPLRMDAFASAICLRTSRWYFLQSSMFNTALN